MTLTAQQVIGLKQDYADQLGYQGQVTSSKGDFEQWLTQQGLMNDWMQFAGASSALIQRSADPNRTFDWITSPQGVAQWTSAASPTHNAGLQLGTLDPSQVIGLKQQYADACGFTGTVTDGPGEFEQWLTTQGLMTDWVNYADKANNLITTSQDPTGTYDQVLKYGAYAQYNTSGDPLGPYVYTAPAQLSTSIDISAIPLGMGVGGGDTGWDEDLDGSSAAALAANGPAPLRGSLTPGIGMLVQAEKAAPSAQTALDSYASATSTVGPAPKTGIDHQA